MGENEKVQMLVDEDEAEVRDSGNSRLRTSQHLDVLG
jgi:hypothetical protein